MTTKTLNPVCHFEIPVNDVEKAKDFYSIFNWDINDIPGMDYVSIRTAPVDEHKMPTQPGTINGGMMKRTDEIKRPVFAIAVDSIEDYCQKVTAKGGRIVMPKIEIPNMGFYCYVADPEENILGLWQAL